MGVGCWVYGCWMLGVGYVGIRCVTVCGCTLRFYGCEYPFSRYKLYSRGYHDYLCNESRLKKNVAPSR